VVRSHASLVVAAILGCGQIADVPATPDGSAADVASPFPATDYQSGSRLRAEVYASAGGATMFYGWFDQQLNAECSFRLAEDGILRCLPLPRWNNVVFSDAACTVPSGVVVMSPSNIPYAFSNTFCGTHPVYRADLTTTVVQPAAYVLSDDGTCAGGAGTVTVSPIVASRPGTDHTGIQPVLQGGPLG